MSHKIMDAIKKAARKDMRGFIGIVAGIILTLIAVATVLSGSIIKTDYVDLPDTDIRETTVMAEAGTDKDDENGACLGLHPSCPPSSIIDGIMQDNMEKKMFVIDNTDIIFVGGDEARTKSPVSWGFSA